MNYSLNNLQSVHLVTTHDNAVWTNSLIIADRFGKRHADVLRTIQHLECSDEFNQRNFAFVEYIDEKGELRPMVELTRDGAMFLIMGFTGAEAARWKEAFIEAFNEAEKRLSHRCPDLEAMGEELIALNPYWREIRNLTMAGKSIDATCRIVPMSRSAVGRARLKMHYLGLLRQAPFYKKRELEVLMIRGGL